MNQQHYQNLMANMGRGMPNVGQQGFQMNKQITGQIGQPGMQMQPGMGQQVGIGHPQIQRHIFSSLQSQGPFSGWQANVSIQERAGQVRQLVDSLRLVRPPVELPRAVEVALQFERKCFSQSTSKEDYFRECSDKLGRIRDQRAQQVTQTANNMQGMPIQNQNFQQVPHMGQQNMQNIQPIPNVTMQQHMQQQQAMQPSSITNQQNRANMPGQQIRNNAANPQSQSRPNQATELSNEDNQQINLRAAELAKETSKEQMRQIGDRMNPQLRANLQAKGVEPIIYYFRMMATREFRKRKAEANGQIINNTGQMSNQNPFSNEMGRYQGLQAEGLRSQETGEMVVPVSNNQGAPPTPIQMQQQMLQNQQRMGQQNANVVNPAMVEQQRRMAAQKQAQMRSQQAAQHNAAQPNANAQGAPPSNTPLSMLNRPVNSNIPGVSPQTTSRPPSRVPMVGQPSGQPGISMLDVQQREKLLAQHPVSLQNILRQKPQNEWQAVIQAFKQNNMQRSVSQQAPGMPQGQHMQNGAFVGGANIGATPMQQSLSTGAVAQDPDMPGMQSIQPQISNEQLMRQRQAIMQQQHAQRRQAEQTNKQQPPMFRPLNQGESNFMDKQQVHPTVMNNIRQQAQVPPNVRVWLDLKRWALQNPIPNIPMPQLIKIQANQFAFQMRASSATQGAVGQQQQQHQQQQPDQMSQMPAQGMTPQPQGVSRIQPPSMEDIQKMRTMNPKFQQLTDDQIRSALMNRQKQQIQSQMAQRQAQAQAQAQTQAGQMPQMMPQAQHQQLQQPHPQQQPSRQQQIPKPQPVPKKASEPPQQENKVAPQQGPQQQLRQLTKDEFNAMPNQQKQIYMRQVFGRRISELSRQANAAMPPRVPVNMDAATRNRVLTKLRSPSVKEMLSRYDQFMFAYSQIDKSEAELMKLVRYKLQLIPLFEPRSIQDKSFVPNEVLVISADQLDEIINDLGNKFQRTFAQLPKTQPPAQLTPENLSRLEAQELERKKSKGSNVPAAPTTTQPPFQFGDTRGHGTPKYASPGLKQEDLKMPADLKRRKKNQAGTPQTPLSAGMAPTPQQPQKAEPTAPSHTCNIMGCERQSQPFSTLAELDQHVNTTHKIEVEPVTDPLAFLDASLREAFNLDENFKQIKKPEIARPAIMQRSASKVSANVKAESRAATPSAMTRTTSQNASSVLARSKSQTTDWKDDLRADGIETEQDLWKHSNITFEEINSIFGNIEWEDVVPPAAATKLQDEFIAHYQQSKEWQKLLNDPSNSSGTNTQESSSPSPAKDKEPVMTTDKEQVDDTYVDLKAIDGLDLTNIEDLMHHDTKIHSTDMVMGDDDDASPFEMIEKPELTQEQQFLLQQDIDYTRPDKLNDGQRQLMDFIMEPEEAVPEPSKGTVNEEWWDIDWDAAEQQRLDDVKNGVPGTWTGNGFIPHLR